MIVIAGSVVVRPDRLEDATRAALAMAEATRREDGCIAYRFSSDLATPNVILVFEEWESAAALARHFETEHMRTFRAQLPGLLAEAPTLKRYEVRAVSAM